MVIGVKLLAVFARATHQTDYTVMNMSLNKEWHFVQCATPGVGPLFKPPETVLRDDFLPDLLGGRRDEVTDSLYKRINWGVKRAGIWIPYPTQNTLTNFDT